MTTNEKIVMLRLIQNKDVINVSEVAILTGRSKFNIYELVRLNLIPYSRPEGTKKLYFDKAKIIDWMKGNKNN